MVQNLYQSMNCTELIKTGKHIDDCTGQGQTWDLLVFHLLSPTICPLNYSATAPPCREHFTVELRKIFVKEANICVFPLQKLSRFNLSDVFRKVMMGASVNPAVAFVTLKMGLHRLEREKSQHDKKRLKKKKSWKEWERQM